MGLCILANFICSANSASGRLQPMLLQSKVLMADIHPFRAFRYDSQKVSPAQVVTQPYDKISPGLQDRYYAASPYNLVRIILGRRETTDDAANNVYSRAAASFSDWRKQGILRQDSQPSIYVYSQRFNLPGSTTVLERRGISSPSVVSRITPLAPSSATNKPWPSPRPTASICSEQPAPTSDSFSCFMRTPARLNRCYP